MFDWKAIKFFLLGLAAGIASHRNDWWAGGFLLCFVIAAAMERHFVVDEEGQVRLLLAKFVKIWERIDFVRYKGDVSYHPSLGELTDEAQRLLNNSARVEKVLE